MDDHLYSAEDFITDGHFQDWVQNPSPESDQYWKNWFREHPGHLKAAEEARLFLRMTRFRQYVPTVADEAGVWHRIGAAEAKMVSLNPWRTLWRVAAGVLLLLAAAGGWYFYQYAGPATVSTSYAQTRIVTLPDGSVVYLNANSHLKYNRSWPVGHDREVWLEGEAFFEVTKKRTAGGDVRFRVHAGALDVEVLGTRFDVNTRHQATRVVLTEGKVRLRSEDNQEMTIKPGELAHFHEKEGQFRKQSVDPEEYSAWRENRVIFNESTLEEVARGLEDYFGYQVSFADPALRSRTFQGTFPADNPEVWLNTLSRSFPLRVDEKNKKAVFGADPGAEQ